MSGVSESSFIQCLTTECLLMVVINTTCSITSGGLSLHLEKKFGPNLVLWQKISFNNVSRRSPRSDLPVHNWSTISGSLRVWQGLICQRRQKLKFVRTFLGLEKPPVCRRLSYLYLLVLCCKIKSCKISSKNLINWIKIKTVSFQKMSSQTSSINSIIPNSSWTIVPTPEHHRARSSRF